MKSVQKRAVREEHGVVSLTRHDLNPLWNDDTPINVRQHMGEIMYFYLCQFDFNHFVPPVFIFENPQIILAVYPFPFA